MTLQPTLTEAIRYYKAGQAAESHARLKDYLRKDPQNIDALLWLARVSAEPGEAQAAAQLALALDPANEIARRAILAVQQRRAEGPAGPLDLARLTGLTLSQARAVLWPFGGHGRPMGVLLDEGLIAARDLAWAAQNANQAYLRQAARALLFSLLLETGPDHTLAPARVVYGGNYLENRILFHQLWGGILIGILASIAIVMLGLDLLRRFYPDLSLLAGLLSLGLFALALAVLFPIANSLVDRKEILRLGRQGERQALDALRAALQTPWVIFQNFAWPHRKTGDVDLLLAGPSGLWVLEVKAYTRPVRVHGDRWQYRGRFGWRTLRKTPATQARRNAVLVKDYLESRNLYPGWVQPVVVWAGEERLLEVSDPSLPVWKLSEIPERLEILWQRPRLSAAEIASLVSALERASRAVQHNPRRLN